jgi:hypothetical protein
VKPLPSWEASPIQRLENNPLGSFEADREAGQPFWFFGRESVQFFVEPWSESFAQELVGVA